MMGVSMPKPRDLQGIIFGVTEIAYSTAFFLFHFENWTSLFNATFFLNVLAYLTFIVFATIAFHQLSYKWLRTIIAFIVFSGRSGGPLCGYYKSID